QLLGTLSRELRGAMLTNASLKICLTLGDEDAKVMGDYLATGTGWRIKKVVLTPGGNDRDELIFNVEGVDGKPYCYPHPAMDYLAGEVDTWKTSPTTLYARNVANHKRYLIDQKFCQSLIHMRPIVVGGGP